MVNTLIRLGYAQHVTVMVKYTAITQSVGHAMEQENLHCKSIKKAILSINSI